MNWYDSKSNMKEKANLDISIEYGRSEVVINKTSQNPATALIIDLKMTFHWDIVAFTTSHGFKGLIFSKTPNLL